LARPLGTIEECDDARVGLTAAIGKNLWHRASQGGRVAAVSPEDGRELWSAAALKGNEETLNSALVLPNDRVLLTHANEAWLLRIVRQNNRLVAEEVWRSPRVRISMSPAIHVNGSLYAFSGGQPLRPQHERDRRIRPRILSPRTIRAS
jgi:hypothetical protein